MDLKEINELINIRRYTADTVNNFHVNKVDVSYINGLILLLDKKIISLLKQDEFKEYINYQDVKQAIEETAKLNNFKSGLVAKK